MSHFYGSLCTVHTAEGHIHVNLRFSGLFDRNIIQTRDNQMSMLYSCAKNTT